MAEDKWDVFANRMLVVLNRLEHVETTPFELDHKKYKNIRAAYIATHNVNKLVFNIRLEMNYLSSLINDINLIYHNKEHINNRFLKMIIKQKDDLIPMYRKYSDSLKNILDELLKNRNNNTSEFWSEIGVKLHYAGNPFNEHAQQIQK